MSGNGERMQSFSTSRLQIIDEKIRSMLDEIISSNRDALQGYETKEKIHYEQSRARLLTLEVDADAIDDAIVALFGDVETSREELHVLVTYLKVVNELVRIGIGTRKYAKRIEAYCTDSGVVSPFGSVVVPLHKSALRALELVRDCFADLSYCDVEENYRKVMVEESKNDDLYGIVEQEIMHSIEADSERSVDFVNVLGTLRKLERICDRAVNIANLLIFAKTGGKLSTYSA